MKTPLTMRSMGVVTVSGLLLVAGLCVSNASKGPNAKDNSTPPLSEESTAPARALGSVFAAVARTVKPSVVSVSSEKMQKIRDQEFPFGDDFLRRFFGDHFEGQGPEHRERRVPQRGMGTGIIIDRAGYVLTNYHVVRDVDEISIILPDRRSFPAKVVGTDPKSDVAVIMFKGKPPSDLVVAQLGDSDAPEVGEFVLAIGAPFGLTQTVTAGIISAKGRSNVGIADFEDFLQTDAAINPGNSGGPLVNMRGQIIGLNTAIATSVGQYSGVGFSIPANMIKAELPILMKGGSISRGMIGVVIQDLTPELAKKFRLPAPPSGGAPQGVLVAQVNPGSPAEKAGLKPGDIIVGFRGKPVENMGQFRNGVAQTAPDSKVDIEFMREGKKQTVSVTVGKLPMEGPGAGPTAPSPSTGYGFAVEPLTPALAKRLGYENEHGVVIAQVADGSVAALAGLQAGDLVVEADRQKVNSVSDLEAILNKNKDQEGLLLLVKRKGASLFVVLRKP
jgi:serine protease Do